MSHSERSLAPPIATPLRAVEGNEVGNAAAPTGISKQISLERCVVAEGCSATGARDGDDVVGREMTFCCAQAVPGLEPAIADLPRKRALPRMGLLPSNPARLRKFSDHGGRKLVLQ